MAKNTEATAVDGEQTAAPKAKRATGPRIARPKYVALRVTDEYDVPVQGVQLEVVASATEADGTAAVIKLINLNRDDPAIVAFSYVGNNFKRI